MKRYIKGRRKEYDRIKYLEAQGYYCIRSAGSKGLFDIVALNKNEIILEQVKSVLKTRKFIKEINLLRNLYDKVPSNVTIRLAVWLQKDRKWLTKTII